MTALTLDQIHALRSDIGSNEIAEIRERARAMLPLAAIREAAGITQSEMAARLGKSQAAVSKFEGRGDFLLSTLFRHVCAVGGELNISVETPNSHFELCPHEVGDATAFFVRKCENRKEAANFLTEHARQYSLAEAQPRRQHFKHWTRPRRRTNDERLLFEALSD